MGSIDVTSNSQYVALKQSYDSQISTAQQIQDLNQQITDLTNQIQQLGTQGMTEQTLQQIQACKDKIATAHQQIQNLDPSHALTNTDDTLKDPNAVADLTQEETTALSALSIVLNGDASIKAADAAAAQATGGLEGSPGEKPDIMSQVMMCMAMLGDAADSVTKGYMDDIGTNVDNITKINTLMQNVNDQKPGGTDPTAKGTISKDVVDQLQQLGVQMPSDMQLNSDGTYTMPQSDFTTIQTNAQTQNSSLTTLNQNLTISMNKAIDSSQQATTFRSSTLSQWSQLMQKIASSG